MKEVKHYICEVCHAEYAEKKDAVACEANHKPTKEISQEVYMPRNADKSGYPYKIAVKMLDGQTVWFKRMRSWE